MPALDFGVEAAEVLPFAAAPSLLFKLRLENADGEPVRSVALNTQIRIATSARHYTDGEQARLVELFGPAYRWGDTLKSLLWAQTTTLVPAFTGSTLVDLSVPCTYDFDVVSAKYFHSLEDGEVPLDFLFSGTVFYAADSGLQAAQISWDKEARYRLPVCLWQQMMEHYFPNSAWLRVRKDTFDRLYQYRAQHGLPTWEDTLDRLLGAREEG